MTVMNQTGPNLRTHLGVLNRRKSWFIGAAALILVVSATIALLLPPVYRSQSTILIEQQEIPQELVRSTITSFADQRVQMISQRVMTRANLLEIIRKFDLYPEDRGKEPAEVLVERMRDDMNMRMVSADVVDPRSGRPTQATIAFTLSYDYHVPALAQKVASELTTLYLNENLKNRTQMAAETSDFLAEEAEKLSKRVEDLESRLAGFKTANTGKLPELTEMNLQMLDRTDREILNIEQQMRTLEQNKAYLETALAQQVHGRTLIGDDGERIVSPADRLKQLRTRYISLSSVYGGTHPDIVRMRKEIDALEKEAGQAGAGEKPDSRLAELESQLALAREKYSPDHPDVRRLERMTAAYVHGSSEGGQFVAVSDNPAYVELQARLEAARSELLALADQRQQLRIKMADYEKRLVETPQIEKEYRGLMRDYENTMMKYRETRAKQMEAQLARSLEAERKGERFTLIEPPTLPEEPLRPNRIAIFIVGLVFALAGGLASAYARDKLDDSVWADDAAALAFGLTTPVLIPCIATEEDMKRRRLHRRLGMAAVILVVISAAVMVHLFHSPLDVLWYSAARRMGI